MPLLLASIGGIAIGTVLLFVGVLSITYNKRSAEEYARNWGRSLKNGYAVGRIISIAGGIFFILVGVLIIFIRRG